MKRQALLLLGLALVWLMAASATLAEDAGGEQPPETPRKGNRTGRNKAPGTTPAAPPTNAANKAPKKANGRPATKPQRPAKGPAKGGPAKGQPQEGEEEEEGEEGSVFVLPDKDAVVLRDGTRVDGTILCAGQAAVTILTATSERTIPREQIERVIQNADAGVPEKFTAEESDGHKYLRKGDALEPPPAKATGPAAPAILPPGLPVAPAAPQPKPAGEEPGAEAPEPPAPPAPAPPKAQPPVAQPPAAPQPPAGLPAIALPKDPAQLRAYIEQLRRDGKLEALLKDPRALEALRNALRQKAAP